MSQSKEEEIIAALWFIAAVLSFGFGFTFWGWVFAIKGAADTAFAFYYAYQEVKDERVSMNKSP